MNKAELSSLKVENDIFYNLGNATSYCSFTYLAPKQQAFVAVKLPKYLPLKREYLGNEIELPCSFSIKYYDEFEKRKYEFKLHIRWSINYDKVWEICNYCVLIEPKYSEQPVILAWNKII